MVSNGKFVAAECGNHRAGGPRYPEACATSSRANNPAQRLRSLRMTVFSGVLRGQGLRDVTMRWGLRLSIAIHLGARALLSACGGWGPMARRSSPSTLALGAIKRLRRMGPMARRSAPSTLRWALLSACGGDGTHGATETSSRFSIGIHFGALGARWRRFAETADEWRIPVEGHGSHEEVRWAIRGATSSLMRKARRRRESNPLVAVLQTAAFPLGYSAIRMRAMGISEVWEVVNRARRTGR
jgi:hypothetical protein